MPNTFTIKYLFELYPDTDFSEEFVICQTIEETNKQTDVQATEDKWGDIRDSTNRKRLVQTTILRQYEVKIITSRNIGVPILEGAEYISLTTTEGETFLIYDVEASYNKVPGSLNYVVDLKFKRSDNNVINHLSSDNVLAYKTATSTAVNEIQYDVDNPAYSFNNVSFYRGSTPFLGEFKIPLTDLTDKIVSGDTYYLHTDNPTFNALTDIGGDNINFANYKTKDSDYVYFVCSVSPVASGWAYNCANITIDHESDGRDLPSGITVADKTISFAIYTLIEPFFDHITTEVNGINAPDGIQENQKTIEKDIARFKVWVTTSELYKIEYLNYALFNDILISLKNYDNIIPSLVKEISKRKENKALIDLYEYDIEVLYNNKVVSIYR